MSAALRDAYADTDRDAYRNANAYPHADAYSDAYSDADAYSDTHSDADAYGLPGLVMRI